MEVDGLGQGGNGLYVDLRGFQQGVPKSAIAKRLVELGATDFDDLADQ